MRAKYFLYLLIVIALVGPAAQAATGPAEPLAVKRVKVLPRQDVVTINAAQCTSSVGYRLELGERPAAKPGGHFEIEAKLLNPKNQIVSRDSDLVYYGVRDAGSFSPSCGPKLVTGRYTIAVKATYYDSNDKRVETRYGRSKVRIVVNRPAPTKLVIRKSPYGSRGWQWTGRLTSNGKPLAGQRIDLWWDFFGWDDYGLSKRTNRDGVAHWTSNPNGALGGINFQLVFEGTKRYRYSESAVFDIAPRR